MTRTIALALLASALQAQSYTYDAAGRLIRVAWPNGRGIEYTYDAADNLLRARPLSLPPAAASVSARQTAPGSNRVEWTATGTAPDSWLIRRRAPNGEWQNLATVSGANTTFQDNATSGIAYEYQVAASTGGQSSAWSRPFQASNSSRVELNVPLSGFAEVSTLGSATQVRGGSVNLDVVSGSIPYGSASFTYLQNGVVASEAAVPASPPTTRGRIFVEERTGLASPTGHYPGTISVSTGVGLTNPNSAPVELDLTLRDRNGAVVVSAKGVLDANAHTALLVPDLRTIAPGFIVPPSFAQTSGFGSLELASSLPISFMALRATTNQRNEVLFTSIPVADLRDEPATGPAAFPHFADGGGFTTALALMNTTSNALTGVLEFYSSAGALVSSSRYAMPPNGAFLVETDGRGEVRSGWVRMLPDSGQPAPAGAGIFRLVQNNTVVSESGVPAAAPSTRVLLFMDRRAGRDTGAALANPSGSQATVTLRLLIPGGPARVALLPPNGHLAAASADLIASLPDGFSGVVEVQSSTPLAALTLRFLNNSRSELIMSTLPVGDLTRIAPSPVVFPHIADGGGFRTQLLLLGSLSPSLATAFFRDDFGNPLEVAQLP